MTIIIIFIVAALLFAVIAKTKNTTVSVSHNFGDADIRELIREYLSLKLKSVNVLKQKKGGDKGEPAVQNCKKQ